MAENESTDSTTAGEDANNDDSATEQTDGLGEAGKRAIDRMKAERDDARKQARAHERELERVRAATLSESERAVAEARQQGRQEAAVEAGKRLARAEIRAAAAGKGLDVADLLEDLDLSRFVGEDGEPDDKAISKAITRWAAISPPSARPRGAVDQGARGDAPAAAMNTWIRQATGRA